MAGGIVGFDQTAERIVGGVDGVVARPGFLREQTIDVVRVCRDLPVPVGLLP